MTTKHILQSTPERARKGRNDGGLLDPSVWSGKIFDGSWSSAPTAILVDEPATGATLAEVGGADPAVVQTVVANAVKAQCEWGGASLESRACVMRKAAQILERHTEEVVHWIVREAGSVEPKAQFEIQGAIGELTHAAAQIIHPEGQLLCSPDPERLSIARRTPLGVIGVITPWNFPLLLAMRSVAPALVLGNAVVLKPDPQTPICGGVVLARLFEEAGLPAGILSVIPGGADVGEALITAGPIRMVTFTGSTAVGRRVGELAGKHLKKVALELGGNSPLIILEDCDLAKAVSAGAWGSFSHQGQVCMATSRHIVHRTIADAYLDALTRKAAALPVGNPALGGVALGPLINRKQRDRVHRIVTESVSQGANLLTGGIFDHLFYRPTVLGRITPTMPAFAEEIFGPVAPVIVAEDDDHAIELANATDYGLAAAVQTGSLNRGLRIARRLRAGMVHVNDQTVNDLPQCPMGGMGQSGNGSRFGSLNSWDEFTAWQWLTASGSSPLYPM